MLKLLYFFVRRLYRVLPGEAGGDGLAELFEDALPGLTVALFERGAAAAGVKDEEAECLPGGARVAAAEDGPCLEAAADGRAAAMARSRGPGMGPAGAMGGRW